MENRYLFRAKRIDNGEWVEGFLFQLCYDSAFCWCIGNEPLSPNDYSELYGFNREWFYIDESTICQCTGLKDKNGKLIWENDVVEMYDMNTDYRWRAVATFGNPNGEYTWGWQLKPIGECEANKDILCWIDMEESGAFCEVIGSAIDNPELLE